MRSGGTFSLFPSPSVRQGLGLGRLGVEFGVGSRSRPGEEGQE